MTAPDRELFSLLGDESFQRWLSRRASAAETEEWVQWLSQEPVHQELYAQALFLWERAHFRPAALPAVEQEWHKLQTRLTAPATKSTPALRLPVRDGVSLRTGSMLFSWIRFAAGAAAVLLVVVVLGRYFVWPEWSLDQQMQIASTAFGERNQLLLPDSTRIILNANSTLRYPAFWKETTPRQFDLRGEAYFEVASLPQGPQHDFFVHTRDGIVRVVGTHFVVHDRGQGTRVVVEEGGVEVAVADTSSSAAAAKVLLTSGNLVHFHKGARTLIPSVVNVGPYMYWWHDQLILQDTPFQQVLYRLEETYGIQTEVKDEHLLKRTLSGAIENGGLEVITTALATALQVPVRREGQVVIFGK